MGLSITLVSVTIRLCMATQLALDAKAVAKPPRALTALGC